MTRTLRQTTHCLVHGPALLTLMLAITPAPAVAQTSAPSVQKAEKKWSLVRGRVAGGSDAAPAIEAAMRAAGFDDTMPNFFGGGFISYPFSGGTSSGSETDLTYRHNRRLAFGLRRTSVELGSTHGHQEPNRWIRVGSKVTTYAPLAYFRVNRNLRVGAGPLAASTDVSSQPDTYEPGATQSFRSTVYGGLVTVSLEGQFLRYFVVGLNASRVWIPDVAAGPFTDSSASNGTVAVPAMRVTLGHQTIGLSLGIRF